MPIVWSNVMALTYVQNQTILVKAFSTALETGFYALTSRLLTPILILKGILYRVLVPIFSESALDRTVLTVRLEKIFPILGLIFIPISTLAIPAVEVLLVPLFGGNYAGAILPFQISIAAFFVTGLGSAFGSVVLASGDARTPTIGLTIGTGIAIGLSVLIIPRYGAARGAAAAGDLGNGFDWLYHPEISAAHKTRDHRATIQDQCRLADGTCRIFSAATGCCVAAVRFIGIAIVLTGIGLGLAGEISRDHLSGLWQLIRKPVPGSGDSK